jgi:hypothetical protein
MKVNHFFTKFILIVFFLILAIAKTNQDKVLAVPADVIGEIKLPASVDGAGYDKKTGLMKFISNLIKFATIAGGLFVLYNLIMAGFIFISKSGDANAYAQLSEKVTMSIIGLMVIVLSYTIIGLVGLIVFKDATYILSPTIHGPGTT